MTRKQADEEAIIYVEREDSSIVPMFLIGALVGAGLALLLSPGTGEQNRRTFTRRMRSLRALAEEKADEVTGAFSRSSGDPVRAESGSEYNGTGGFEDEEQEAAPASMSAREELERRLEEARARRRSTSAAEDEEPLA